MSNKITQQELVDLYVKNNKTYFLLFEENIKKIICVYVGEGKKVHLSRDNETYCGAGNSFKMSRRPSYKFKVYENEFPTSMVCNKCVSLPKAVA
jgi:hypothetical protein